MSTSPPGYQDRHRYSRKTPNIPQRLVQRMAAKVRVDHLVTFRGNRTLRQVRMNCLIWEWNCRKAISDCLKAISLSCKAMKCSFKTLRTHSASLTRRNLARLRSANRKDAEKRTMRGLPIRRLNTEQIHHMRLAGYGRVQGHLGRFMVADDPAGLLQVSRAVHKITYGAGVASKDGHLGR